MSGTERVSQELQFTFAGAGSAVSISSVKAGHGVMGTIIVPSGSLLIGKTVQFVATSPSGKFADTDLLTTPKTLAAGSNPLSSDEILQVGAVDWLKLKINSAVASDSSCVLLWKS